MRRDRYYCSPISQAVVQLTGAEAHHLARVRRARVADVVELFDGAGVLAEAKVVAIKKETVDLEVVRREQTEPPTTGHVVIACSLAKGERFDWLISKCTELGVQRIAPVRFARTVKQAAGERQRRLESLRCSRLYIQQVLCFSRALCHHSQLLSIPRALQGKMAG